MLKIAARIRGVNGFIKISNFIRLSWSLYLLERGVFFILSAFEFEYHYYYLFFFLCPRSTELLSKCPSIQLLLSRSFLSFLFPFFPLSIPPFSPFMRLFYNPIGNIVILKELGLTFISLLWGKFNSGNKDV